MTCEACTQAEASPWLCGSYMNGCQGCEARTIANSPAAKEARLGFPGEMEASARKMWPTKTACKRGWVEIWRWIESIDEAKAIP